MTRLRHRRPRLRLDLKSYRRLCRQILKRDGWRRQDCGSQVDLQVHHMNPRGQMGDDTDENLITL